MMEIELSRTYKHRVSKRCNYEFVLWRNGVSVPLCIIYPVKLFSESLCTPYTERSLANALITIAIRLRYDYDPTTTYHARLLPFGASKK